MTEEGARASNVTVVGAGIMGSGIRNTVAAGRLGRKSGAGFYEYDS